MRDYYRNAIITVRIDEWVADGPESLRPNRLHDNPMATKSIQTNVSISGELLRYDPDHVRRIQAATARELYKALAAPEPASAPTKPSPTEAE